MARLKRHRSKAAIIGAYAPEKAKTDESIVFYDTLQKLFDRLNTSDQIILMCALNVRVDVLIPIVGSFGSQ